MIHLFKMAWRDLGRNRRRSFFSALALGIGMALLLLIASVLRGEMHGAMETSIKLYTGELQIRAGSYEEDKTSLAWEDLIENPETIVAQVASLAPVTVATPRLYASGILDDGENSVGVRIVGIDPASPANAPFQEGLLEGKFLTVDDREGILVGYPLADKLGLSIGDQVSLMANTSNGDVDGQTFTIRGVYTTRTPGYDGSTVFMPLAKAQALTKTENHASIIFIRLKDRNDTDAVVSALQAGQYQVKTWQQMNEMLSQFEEFAGAYMIFIYLIVLAVTATVIINTLIMAVFERTREIGILAAIGMRGGRIMAMFFAESSLLAVGGILIGMILGGLLVYWVTVYGFYIGDMGLTGILIGERIYGYLTVDDAVSLTIVAFIVTLLAALYPALLAARMEPVDALHSEK